MSRISRLKRCRSKFDELQVLSCPGASGYKNYNDDQSSSANVSKRKKSEKTGKIQQVRVSGRPQSLDEMLALADKKSKARNLNTRLARKGLCNPQSRSTDSSTPSGFSSRDFWDEFSTRDNKSKEQKTISEKDMLLETKGSRGCQQFPTSLAGDNTMSPSSKLSELSISYSSCFRSEYDNPEEHFQDVRDEMDNCLENYRYTEIERSERNSKSINSVDVSSRINGDSQSESSDGILSGEGGHSSNVQEVFNFNREASFSEYSDGESAYSSCSRKEPMEFHKDLKRTNQHSPDSVLEPFDAQSSSSECFDSIGLQLQLQAFLNFELEETFSEGSVMVVSGDEDSEEGFGDIPHHDGRNVKRWLGDDQSRNFSYLVDVLDEASVSSMKSFMDFKTWFSLECPINPLVFEALQKKYGNQTSCEKSERRLLFDHINSGLIGMFAPILCIQLHAVSVRRRFFASLRRDEVENELWTMLISQEKEKSKDSSEGILEKWLVLDEGISIICTELEISLFDELVMELAGLCD